MDRRRFLKAAAASAFAAAGQPACSPAEPPAVAPFEMDETTVADLQHAMSSGRLTAQSIVEAYLARIHDLDRRGPALHAFIEISADAPYVAAQLDRERAAGRVRGPLHGIPVLLKDNIDTHDRTTTTAGSLALEGSVPGEDASVARRLRDAGAILLGKANLSEWANIRSTRSSSGWSARGGQCRNPCILDRTPCGSSSGSAVAVAANLTALAVGTETDGSIVCPASATGIVGIKPTVGLVSRTGIIPISHTQDTAGPMARTVTDAAILLTALAAADPRDPATSGAPGAVDYAAGLTAGALDGARIGVARRFFTYGGEVAVLHAAALDALRAAGAVLVDPVELRLPADAGPLELRVLLYEFKAGLNAYLSSLGPAVRVRSLADVIRFNEEHREREMPYFGQELFLEAEAKGPLTDDAYRQALQTIRRAAREDGIDAVMDAHRLDAIVAPTGGPAWRIDPVNGDPHDGGSSSSPAAIAGYPNITVPAGEVDGLPVGLSFFGRAWSEATLVRLAFAFEQGAKARRPPRFRPA